MIVSSRRSSASARPRSTIRLPYSVRLTTPLMISPTRSLYSSNCLRRSTSRTRCTITCLAVCAAMRPKSIGGSGSTMNSPAAMPGLILRAIRRGIWVSSFSTGSASTTSVHRDSRTSPLFLSMVARMSFSSPYFAFPAFPMACSMASSTSSRSIIFSRATASATSRSSGRATETSSAMAISVLWSAGPLRRPSSGISSAAAAARAWRQCLRPPPHRPLRQPWRRSIRQ